MNDGVKIDALLLCELGFSTNFWLCNHSHAIPCLPGVYNFVGEYSMFQTQKLQFYSPNSSLPASKIRNDSNKELCLHAHFNDALVDRLE